MVTIMNKEYKKNIGSQVCSQGVWDSTIPGIEFDENGVSNYAKMQRNLEAAFQRGEKGKKEWVKIVEKIKSTRQNTQYDCIIGVSGGTDSSYLLHLAKEFGLNPLAVHLDNGWGSDISMQNIKKVTSKLGIDLETYVINYEEVKDLFLCYMKASLPWIDNPTDLAIKASLYKIASKENIKYIFRGNDFRSEGKQPVEWTYSDGKQLNYLHSKFGTTKLNTFPNLTLTNLVYYEFIKKIKSIRPFYYLEYKKNEAQEFLKKEYNWEYYGGHHYENIFTKFAVSYWLPEKFGIDKRKITLSAQVMSGEITKEEALKIISSKPYNDEKIDEMIEFLIRKLDISRNEFDEIWQSENKNFTDYPSYYPMIEKYHKAAGKILSKLFVNKPMFLFEKEMRSESKETKSE